MSMAMDIFAADATAHPSLRESCAMSPDIYKSLFDAHMNGDLFDRWLKYRETWPLDIVGGPGAGKTTFAAIAATRIRKFHVMSGQPRSYLATIFIGDGRIDSDLILVEDFLRIVYQQLSPVGGEVGSVVLSKYHDYKSAKGKGRKTSRRISLISQALQGRVAEINAAGQAFLILDNMDQCSTALKELLERELSALQKDGLKIMSTSRLPRYEDISMLEGRACDFHAHDFATDLYWHCNRCQQDICESCKGDGQYCNYCNGESPWTQPEFFTIFIDSVHATTMQNFVAWDLEREHGDLRLGTLSNPQEPPLSHFGFNFRKSKPAPEAGRDWIRNMLDHVGSNVVHVKLALDRIHASSSPDSVDLEPERLPANTQAIFNNGIKAISRQADSQSSLALKSIAIVGKRNVPGQGVPVSDVAAKLNQRHARPSSRNLLPRSSEDILEASRGYLRLLTVNEKPHLMTFDWSFNNFVYNEYNEDLILAHSQLRTSNIPRSITHAPKATPIPIEDTSWSDAIEGLKRYKSPDLASTNGPGPPSPFRRESSGLTRSQTFLPSSTPSSSPYAGLGLDFSWDKA